jgi:ABC-2 type transport system permease protein
MPVYEQTYRRWEARAPLRSLRSWPITREALRLLLARRAFLLLMIASLLPFVGFALYLFLVTQVAQAAQIAPVDGTLFRRFFAFQLPPAFLVTTFAGAGLIANDLRTGAILVYLSRPLTRRDYVIGKLSVLLLLNLCLTLVPGLALYGIGLAMVPDHLLRADRAWLAPGIAAYSVVASLLVSLLALAVSALSRSARVAGLGFFLIAVAPEPVVLVLRAILRSPYVVLASIWEDLRIVCGALLGVAPAPNEPVLWAAAVLAAVGVGCLFVLRARVRAVEIVT